MLSVAPKRLLKSVEGPWSYYTTLPSEIFSVFSARDDPQTVHSIEYSYSIVALQHAYNVVFLESSGCSQMSPFYHAYTYTAQSLETLDGLLVNFSWLILRLKLLNVLKTERNTSTL